MEIKLLISFSYSNIYKTNPSEVRNILYTDSLAPRSTGAYGIRTRDLHTASVARSQLR